MNRAVPFAGPVPARVAQAGDTALRMWGKLCALDGRIAEKVSALQALHLAFSAQAVESQRLASTARALSGYPSSLARTMDAPKGPARSLYCTSFSIQSDLPEPAALIAGARSTVENSDE